MLAIGVPLVVGAGMMVVDDDYGGTERKRQKRSTSTREGQLRKRRFYRPRRVGVQSGMVTYWIGGLRRPG